MRNGYVHRSQTDTLIAVAILLVIDPNTPIGGWVWCTVLYVHCGALTTRKWVDAWHVQHQGILAELHSIHLMLTRILGSSLPWRE